MGKREAARQLGATYDPVNMTKSPEVLVPRERQQVKSAAYVKAFGLSGYFQISETSHCYGK